MAAETNGYHAPTSENNGARPKAPPSLEDLFLHSDKGAPNILQEMITTSINPQEFIPRSNVDKREAAAIQRMIIEFSLWNGREIDIGQMVWNRLAYSIATDGLGRRQTVQMYGGVAARVKEGWQGIGGNSRRKTNEDTPG